MKVTKFMKVGRRKKSQEVALKYLLKKIKSRGKEIDFGSELKCEKCLLPNEILTWNEQVPIFNRPGVAGAVL